MDSLRIAFSMYSRIPVREVDWNDDNMKMAFAWFPLIGVVIGALEMILYWICVKAGLPSSLRGAFLLALPLFITGGIHLDGWMDAVDAKCAWGDAGRRLEIMKDPHIGSFAVLWCSVYVIVSYGAWQTLNGSGVAAMSIGFVFERALSGLGAVNFQNARKGGMLDLFVRPADRKRVTNILLVWAACAGIGIVLSAGMRGLAGVCVALLVFWHYHAYSMRNYGGITGDLAGWFLQNCEIAMLLVLAVLTGSRI